MSLQDWAGLRYLLVVLAFSKQRAWKAKPGTVRRFGTQASRQERKDAKKESHSLLDDDKTMVK